jgi:hypothetical protein
MGEGSQVCRGSRVTHGRADALLRYVDRFEDVAVEYARTGRAPLDETVVYVG